MNRFLRMLLLWIMVGMPYLSEAVSVPYIPQVINYSVSDYKAGNQNWILSVRGVEAARYRLRKKLNLPEGHSLVDFMIQFS